jgi:hypothetical protein
VSEDPASRSESAAPSGKVPRARGRKRGGSLFDSTAAKAIPILAVLFVLLKSYVVARFSLTTAGALVSAAPVSVLIGTVTSYLNTAVVAAALISGIWIAAHLIRGHAGMGSHTRLVDVSLMAIFIVSVALFPVPNDWSYYGRAILYVIATAVLLAACWGAAYFLSRRPRFAALAVISNHPEAVFLLYVVLLLAPTLGSSWVPAEVLVLRDPIAIHDSHLRNGKLDTTKYPVVFVLAENGRWLTVLDEKSRILMRLPIDEVAHRQVCHYTGQPPNSVPLAAYVAGARFHSPNSFCRTLIKYHDRVLDPLVVDNPKAPSEPDR